MDKSTPLLLEVAPEIDTNPTTFHRGGVGGSLRLQTPVIGSRSPCLSTPHILTWRRPCLHTLLLYSGPAHAAIADGESDSAQVCVQLQTSAVNTSLPAFAAERRAAIDRCLRPARRSATNQKQRREASK